MHIESVLFKNFKALRDTTLPLGPLTLMIGPNGSGKSTAVRAIQMVGEHQRSGGYGVDPRTFVTLGAPKDEGCRVEVNWPAPLQRLFTRWWIENPQANSSETRVKEQLRGHGGGFSGETIARLRKTLSDFTVFAFNPTAIAANVQLKPGLRLQADGSGLAGVLDRLRDEDPEAFDRFNEDVRSWLPEFDRVLFDTPDAGFRSLRLRLRGSRQSIPARELSEGTLLALAFMSLAYAPDMPDSFAIEEPERGIHPRLLVDVRGALWRLTHPNASGETRPARQVIVTTHSPYLLDLFRDTPEDVVVAEKTQGAVQFKRLADRDDLELILGATRLGDAWYSGVLGGIPTER